MVNNDGKQIYPIKSGDVENTDDNICLEEMEDAVVDSLLKR
jgi:hypothetical protein